MTDYEVSTTVKVSDDALRDLIITAVEGGVGYWAQTDYWHEGIWDTKNPADIFTLWRYREDHDRIGDEETTESEPWRTIDPAKLARAAVERVAHTGTQIEDFDADDADACIQQATFGEQVYG